MIKVFNIYEYERLEYEKLKLLFKQGNNNFNYDQRDTIYYKEENEKFVEDYLGIKMETTEELSVKYINEYIEYCDGGEYLVICNNLQITKDECISQLQEDINLYEERILNAEDVNKEIEKIIREQMYKVFLKYIDEGFKKIDNSNFKWK